ncbi:MAG: choice-of-anchor D domain-containing protein [Chlorobi bacterium]|nr:choice-of-anchor D domain-containing protein [Chlorobiota bacterium]
MKRAFYLQWLSILSFAITASFSQSFTLVDVDVSSFPRVRSQFIAFDQWGNQYLNLQPSDFLVRENGRSVQSSLQVSCEESREDPTAHIVLIVDKSTSMLEIVNRNPVETRWDWVKEGVREFVTQFPFTPPSSVALVSFAGEAYLESDFRTSAQPIIDAMERIRPQGSTKYDPPMLDTLIGAIKLLSQKPRDVRRIIVFLTDGQPDTQPSTDTIIARCRREAITFYAITVGLNMNSDLDRIARATGGKTFAVFSKDRLKEIYRLIALEAVIRYKCYLEWTAPWSCTEQERIRNVAVSFLRPSPPLNATIQYIAPPQSLARVDVTPQVAYFGNPNPGTSTTVKLTIKATGAPMQITGIPIVPTGYYTVVDMAGRSIPFTLQPGEVWEPTVQFTQQGSKQYRQATLTIDGQPCPTSITLIGGLSKAIVISPNGGELFSTCDSVNIRWAGVEPTQGVDIFYALDGNQTSPTWQTIARNVTGLSYRWKPPQAGQAYRIRVVVPPDSGYVWAQQIGGSSFDTCRSIVLDGRQLYVHVAGTFTNSAQVNGTTLTSYGESDMFIARFDTDGNLIWARNGGGNRSDEGCCIAIDNNDYLYVAGIIRSSTAQFGGVTVNKNTLDQTNAYVALYNTNGNAVQVVIGGGSPTTSCEVYVDSIGFSGSSIYLYGRFRGRLQFSTTPGTFITSANQNRFEPFTAVFATPTLNVVNLQRSYIAAPYTRATVRDADNNRYETGGFQNQLQVGSTRLTSRGGSDVFVRKFGYVPGSLDVSDTTFRVQSPLVRFRLPSLDVGSIAVGDAIGQVFSGVLCNDGEIPVIVSAMTFSGPNAQQFQLVSNWKDYVLRPGECVSVEILFVPSFEGRHNATLTVTGNCGSPASVAVTGLGLPPCKYTITQPPTITTSVGLSRQVSGLCLVRNDGPEALTGTIKLVTNPSNAFTVTIPATSCTVDATGCAFDLAPGQCLIVNINFSPTVAGIQNGLLEIEFPAKCGGTRQQGITGIGLAPEFRLVVPQFGDRRVATTTTWQARLQNLNDTLDGVITAIRLRNPNNTHYRLLNLPTLPLTVPASGQATFDVEFTPQAEGDFSEIIEAVIEGIIDPIAAQTNGRGILPKIESNDLTFQPWPTGTLSPETLSLVVRNTSTTSPLTIKSITDPDNTSFWFSAPLPAFPYSIAIGDSLVVPIRFRPIQPGVNTGRIQIVSDAAPGPNPDPSITTTVTVSGIGLALTITPPEDIGEVLLCESVITRTITISNPGSTDEIVSVTVQGDVADFTVVPTNMTIPAGGSATVTIRYTPIAGQRSIVVSLSSSALPQPYQINVTATGVTRRLRIAVGSATIDVGRSKPIPINIETAPDAGSLVTRIQLRLDYPISGVEIDDAAFQTQQNGWTWSVQHLPSGALLTGTSALGIMTGSLQLQVPFMTFVNTLLTHTLTSSLLNATDYPCLTIEAANGIISTPYYCAQESRQITLVGPTTITIRQSPGGDVVVETAIGEDIPYWVEVFSPTGTEVLRIAEGNQRGTYTAVLPTGILPSGVYYVRLRTALRSIVEPIIIIR